MSKARLVNMRDELKMPTVPETPEERPAIDPNPARGGRSDFLKTTITLPEELLGELQRLGRRRRKAGKPNTTISAILREAAADLLKREM